MTALVNSMWSGFLFLPLLTTRITAQRGANCPELEAWLVVGAWGDCSMEAAQPPLQSLPGNLQSLTT